jgi:hypothetical protein
LTLNGLQTEKAKQHGGGMDAHQNLGNDAKIIDADNAESVSPDPNTPPPPTSPNTKIEAAEKPKDKSAAKFAALAREEKKIREEKEALKKEKAEIEAFKAEKEAIERAKANAKSDPIEYLKAAGLDYKYITEFVINNNELSESQKLEVLQAKIEEGEKAREAERKTEAAKQEKAALNQVFHSIETTIKSDPERFELLGQEGDDGLTTVYNVLEEYYSQNPNGNMTFEQAADLTEQYLLDEYKARSQSKKLQPKVPPVAEVGKKEDSSETSQARVKTPTTVTNAASSQSASIPPNLEAMTDKEREKLAIRLLEKSQS